MICWPVPNSYSKVIPKKSCPGSFWEDRGDRHHCGIDIYAPVGSDVISLKDGYVIETGIFTNKNILTYWNKTKYLIIKNIDGFYCVYAELEDVVVRENEPVKTGQVIGHVGRVLNKNRITKNAPLYIQKIKNNDKLSMLHFEVYNSNPDRDKKYLGGNWFGKNKPKNIIDPNYYIKKVIIDNK
jgi:murein DD-endopeptidase MepM/ murein hydrolase activator NlpD